MRIESTHSAIVTSHFLKTVCIHHVKRLCNCSAIATVRAAFNVQLGASSGSRALELGGGDFVHLDVLAHALIEVYAKAGKTAKGFVS